jgi:hypothetical protein
MSSKERIDRRVEERLAHMRANGALPTRSEARESLMAQCGYHPDTGLCQKAGTEYCDWECPFTWTENDE